MEIKIDTNRDSHEDIKKAIRMLQAYLGENVSSYQGSEQSNQNTAVPDASPGMFNIFSDNNETPSETSSYPEDLPQTEILDEKKEIDPDAKVELY